MSRSKYPKELKLKVAKEAVLSENKGMEHIIAEKYDIMPWTVTRWKNEFLDFGNDAFKKKNSKSVKSAREVELEKENAKLREEVEILKKAAAFLANVKHE